MFATFLCLAALPAATPEKDAWAALIEECRAAPQKLAFEDVLARARLLALPGAASPKSPQAEHARARWLGGRNGRLGVPPIVPPPAGALAATGSVALEREPNHTRGWADVLVPGRAVDGDIALPFDVDTFLFELTADSDVEFVTSPGTIGATIVDTTLELTDEHGAPIAFNDDATGLGLFSRIRLPLRTGRYTIRVAGFGDETGAYRLSSAVQPIAFVPLAAGASSQGSTTPQSNVAAYVLSVPSAGRVDVAVNGIAGFDPMLWLCSKEGSALAFNDDAVGLNSALQFDLSAGEYVVYVQGFGGMSGAFDVQTSHLPQALLSACAGGTATIGAAWHRRTLVVEATASPATSVQVLLGTAGAGSANDTMLALYDADWRLLGSNDDAIGLHAAVRMALPPGTYRAVARTFPGSTNGNVAFSGQCATVAPVTALTCGGGVNFALVAGGSRAFHVTADSPVPLVLRATGGLDSVLAVLSHDGRLRDWNDDAGGTFGSAAGVRVGPGGVFAVVTGYENMATGSTELTAHCPLALFGQPGPSATMFQVSSAKAGAYVVTLRGDPIAPLALPVVSGLLLLDLATAVPLGVDVVPASGFANLQQILPPTPTLAGAVLRFQHVAFDLDRGDGWLSNSVDVTW